jgi:hypothetical protein
VGEIIPEWWATSTGISITDVIQMFVQMRDQA